MKLKIILVLLISTLCNAQITLNDLKTILKMDYDSFETFAMNKGFVFRESFKKDNNEGITFSKGDEKDTKHLTLYSTYFEYKKKAVFYQTSKESEYLLIKKQLTEQGFKLIETYDFEGVLHKKYKNKLYLITLRTGKRAEDFSTYNFYCVDIEYIE